MTPFNSWVIRGAKGHFEWPGYRATFGWRWLQIQHPSSHAHVTTPDPSHGCSPCTQQAPRGVMFVARWDDFWDVCHDSLFPTPFTSFFHFFFLILTGTGTVWKRYIKWQTCKVATPLPEFPGTFDLMRLSFPDLQLQLSAQRNLRLHASIFHRCWDLAGDFRVNMWDIISLFVIFLHFFSQSDLHCSNPPRESTLICG